MPLTITVTDPLASDLQGEADLRKIPVDPFALDVLGRAVEKQDGSHVNLRRTTLIRKQFAEGLTPAEAAELQELPRQADKQLEGLDSRMLEDVAAMEKAAEGVLDDRAD